jgi:hypothetical protein
MQVAYPDFAVRPMDKIALEGMAKPVPVEQRRHDGKQDHNAQQYAGCATEFRQSEMHYRRWTTTLRPGAWEKSGER